MEIALTPEQEAQLIQMAEFEGKTPSELLVDTVAHHLEADRYFRERVQRGLAQADAGEFVEEEEMDARVQKMIKPLNAT
jgi:RHH-type rel operon transcriptional repressor/antitoxin RelB